MYNPVLSEYTMSVSTSVVGVPNVSSRFTFVDCIGEATGPLSIGPGTSFNA